MDRSLRLLLAAPAALLCAIPAAAFAQYQPVPVYPPSAPPAQAQLVPVPPPPQPAQPAKPPPPAAQPAPPAQPVKMVPAEPRFQIAAFTGYQLNGDVDGIYGRVPIDDAQSFGISLWSTVRPGAKIELLWIYSQFDAKFDSFTLSYPSTKKFSVDTNYFQIGGVKSVRRGRIEPFGGGTLGAVWYSPGTIQAQNGITSYNASDTWRFAVTLGGGLNVFLTDALAIRFHARMLLPMFFNGGSVYVGTGGSGMAVNAGIPAVSGDFAVGLVFAR